MQAVSGPVTWVLQWFQSADLIVPVALSFCVLSTANEEECREPSKLSFFLKQTSIKYRSLSIHGDQIQLASTTVQHPVS